jgi:hypothetical protein
MKKQDIIGIKIRFKDIIQITLIWFFSILFFSPILLIIYKVLLMAKSYNYKVVIIPILEIIPGIILINYFLKLWNARFNFKKVILHDDGKVTFINKGGQEYLLDIYTDIDIVYADSKNYQITFKKGNKYFIVNSDNVIEKDLFIEFFKRFIKEKK